MLPALSMFVQWTRSTPLKNACAIGQVAGGAWSTITRASLSAGRVADAQEEFGGTLSVRE